MKAGCSDARCAVHGGLKTRGRTLVGRLRNARMAKTATLETERKHYLSKYQRYEKRRTRVKVHNPDCIGARQGDWVRAVECRPLSKTKRFVVVEKIEVSHATDKG